MCTQVWTNLREARYWMIEWLIELNDGYDGEYQTLLMWVYVWMHRMDEIACDKFQK